MLWVFSVKAGHSDAQQRGAERDAQEGQAGARAEADEGRPGREGLGHQGHADPDRALQAGHPETGAAGQGAEGKTQLFHWGVVSLRWCFTEVVFHWGGVVVFMFFSFFLVLFCVCVCCFFSSAFIEGRKEMCYLTMHSTHFIYGYMTSDIMVKNSQIAREEPHGLLFSISSKGSFICTIPQTG